MQNRVRAVTRLAVNNFGHLPSRTMRHQRHTCYTTLTYQCARNLLLDLSHHAINPTALTSTLQTTTGRTNHKHCITSQPSSLSSHSCSSTSPQFLSVQSPPYGTLIMGPHLTSSDLKARFHQSRDETNSDMRRLHTGNLTLSIIAVRSLAVRNGIVAPPTKLAGVLPAYYRSCSAGRGARTARKV